MKVKELIEQLKRLDGDCQVWLPDCWPCPGSAAPLNAIVQESDGSVDLLSITREDYLLHCDHPDDDVLVYVDPENLYNSDGTDDHTYADSLPVGDIYDDED